MELSRCSAYAGHLLAATLPVVLWHHAIGAIAGDLRGSRGAAGPS